MVDIYMKRIMTDGIIYTDTTPISNKYGRENIGRNKYYKNKNISKLSLITDNNKAILNIQLFSGNKNDSRIAVEHLTNLENEKNSAIMNNPGKVHTLIADAGYDSSKVRDKLTKYNIKCIIDLNKRNTKDEKKLAKRKMTRNEKKLYRERIKIEQANALIKKCRRIDVRYDQLEKTYMGFVYMGGMYSLIKHI